MATQPNMCVHCKQFLYDFLETGIHKELSLANSLCIKNIKPILPELCDWMYRFYERLSQEEFDKAVLTSSRIARRDRKLLDYEFLLHTATFNFLKYSVGWISEEVDYIKPFLLESGFVKTRKKQGITNLAYDYISYTTPRAILSLREIHEDHIKNQRNYIIVEVEDDLYN